MSDEPKLVPFARVRRKPHPSQFAEFAATARRLQSEREASSEVVERALRETPRAAWPRLASRTDLQTCGALERLSVEIDARLDREPLEALALAELSTALASSLPSDAYPPIVMAQLRAHAWKDRGQALAFLGRYEEALVALDRAEAQLLGLGTGAHDLAIVRFVRATTLQHLRRFDEAQAILEECRDVFRAHGDTRLYSKSTLAQGNLLVRRGQYRAARATLAPLMECDEEALVPQARMALGWCAIHLGDANEALTQFLTSARECVRVGRDTEAVRALYGAGSALLHLGRFEDAVEQLQSTRSAFLRSGLVEEAGLSGLQIVEAEMVLEHIPEARRLAAAIVREFTAAELNRRAVAALAQLHQAIAASSATPAFVRTVHTYILQLQIDPTREFAPSN